MSVTHHPRPGFLSLVLYRFNPNLSLLIRMLNFSTFKNNVHSIRSIILLALVAAGRDLHVLLADDDADDRDFFIDAVKEVAPNVKVDTVTNGEELIQHLNNGKYLPHLIFLDLNMPIKDGHECLEEIRKDDRLSKIPIIIYSTSSSKEHIDATYNSGATLYVRKPDSYTDLKTITKKIFTLNWENYTQPNKENFFFTAKMF